MHVLGIFLNFLHKNVQSHLTFFIKDDINNGNSNCR
jgi:hypothetical protein